MEGSKHVLIIDARAGARALISRIKKEGHSGISVVGFVGDSSEKQGTRIGTAKVIGTIKAEEI